MPSTRGTRVRLTDARLRNVAPAPAGRRVKIWDSEVRSLLAVVHPAKNDQGTRTVSLMVCVRVGGSRRPVRRLLGHHGSLLVEQARTEAREFLAQVRRGLDPKLERQRQEAKTAAEKSLPVSKVLDEWIEGHVTKLRRAREYKRVVEKELRPYWGSTLICDVSRDMCVKRLQEVGKRAPYVGSLMPIHSQLLVTRAL